MMIICGTWFCVENRKKKQKKTKAHLNTKFLHTFQMVGTKTGSYIASLGLRKKTPNFKKEYHHWQKPVSG